MGLKIRQQSVHVSLKLVHHKIRTWPLMLAPCGTELVEVCIVAIVMKRQVVITASLAQKLEQRIFSNVQQNQR